MIKAKREFLNPPGWPLVVIGVAVGILAGSFSLSDSVDRATAVGFAVFWGISLGGWLGATAIKALNSFFVRVYKNSDSKLVKVREDLTRYFADDLPCMPREYQVGSNAVVRSKEAMARFSSSLNVFRALANVSIYLYPIAGVITFAEITTLGLLAVGGLEVPGSVSMLATVGRAIFVVLLAIYVVTVLSGIAFMRNTLKLFGEIKSLEQLMAAREDGDIHRIFPDTSSLEKAVSVPTKVLARLAA